MRAVLLVHIYTIPRVCNRLEFITPCEATIITCVLLQIIGCFLKQSIDLLDPHLFNKL